MGKKNKKTPSLRQWQKAIREGDDLPSPSAIIRQIGKPWNEILESIGLDVVRSSKSYQYENYTDEELLSLFKADIERLEVVSLEEFRRQAKKKSPSFSTLKKRFSCSWNELLQLASIEPFKTPDKVRESDEELLQKYKTFSKKLGRPATSTDLNNSKEIYNADVFAIRFGGMSNLKKLAGFKERRKKEKKYTKEKIKGLLIQEYLKKPGRLKDVEIKENKNLPSLKTILIHFRTTKTSVIWDEIEDEISATGLPKQQS